MILLFVACISLSTIRGFFVMPISKAPDQAGQALPWPTPLPVENALPIKADTSAPAVFDV
jgi:hypothetical protein